MSSPESTRPINKALLDSCIHCGLCLPACPTYLATGREMESPRGRIYLLTQWNSGEQELTPRLAEHIETCLGCLGCVTACPSGVQYGSILNFARPHIATMRPAGERAILRFAFRNILPSYWLLQIGGWLLRWWQIFRMGDFLKFLAVPTPEYEQAARRGELINPARKLLFRLHEWESLLPKVPEHEALPQTSKQSTAAQPKVQLFSGCVMDVFYNHVNRACFRLLEAQGNNVQVPPQTCCGALAMHAGETDIARNLAKQNIELMEKTAGPIAVTAAGCGAMLKEYPELFNDDRQWHDRAESLANRLVDITEALAGGSFKTAANQEFAPGSKAADGPTGVGVAYHAACHLAHAQNVREAPQSLLQKASADVGIDKMHLIPLREAEHCCGSAGIYNLLNTELSMKVLERKMEFIQQTGAEIVVTTNPGCMLQLEAGARQRGLNIRVQHLCELLDAIYCAPHDSVV